MSTVLQAKNRSGEKKISVRKLRREGNIPAVVYGSDVESTAIYVSEADFARTIKQVGRNGVISLDVDGKKWDVVLSDYQQDVIKNNIVHADFLAVDKSTKINADVNITLVGDASGVRDGGILQQPLFAVSITSTPGNIPPVLEIDITSMQVGDVLTVADLNAEGKFEINNDPDEVIASILPPTVEEEIDTGEQQDGGVPENEEGRETKPSEG
ncbi:50S ribosomal protein L25/general stress protein Ctc [Neobacillus notoginsengisoli]|uniref:Large ribosomal subunit protein bL25 n=1 Tax=Neobacillus notoginsengisoli TaxID=1578198 RepID=A0A417YGD6_9BACI|nr:50S ribosomal protein L25/general stress protein Ctc [Neobacillus notoginsengisoli]RHW31806.1 50S ribosomal protein L25/general stress protein Ctc [Neobacillus notoginsengisoli]